jgi:hypothetical protein
VAGDLQVTFRICSEFRAAQVAFNAGQGLQRTFSPKILPSITFNCKFPSSHLTLPQTDYLITTTLIDQTQLKMGSLGIEPFQVSRD